MIPGYWEYKKDAWLGQPIESNKFLLVSWRMSGSEFCKELIKRKLNIRFIIETHLRILDSELIKILKLAGLKGVKVGVESGDEEVLKNANRFIDLVNPELTVFVKYDIWPNVLNVLKRRKKRAILISALLRPNQIFFKPYGKHLKDALFAFEHMLYT